MGTKLLRKHKKVQLEQLTKLYDFLKEPVLKKQTGSWQ
jgi:hypothetical protein